jgi:hypothetical protein
MKLESRLATEITEHTERFKSIYQHTPLSKWVNIEYRMDSGFSSVFSVSSVSSVAEW